MASRAVAALVGALILGCVLFADAIPSRGDNCCTTVGNNVTKKLLRRVVKSVIQRVDGVCDIPAIVLYTKHKQLCANPNNKNIKKWMKTTGVEGKKVNKSAKKRYSKTRKNKRNKRKRKNGGKRKNRLL